jgi:hypothetical protein
VVRAFADRHIVAVRPNEIATLGEIAKPGGSKTKGLAS